MKIAVISYRLPLAGEKRGGIERMAHVLADGLSRRGHSVVVFSHDPRPPQASYEVRLLPWKSFVETWVGLRMTAGYLGNLLALQIDVRDFDVIIAHGDSLLLSMGDKPVVRVMHGSARSEALHATSVGRAVLQWGVYLQELLTAFLSPSVVAVSESTRRDNRYVRRVIPNGIDTRAFHPLPIGKSTHPTIVFVGALNGRKRGSFLLGVFERVIRPAFPEAELIFVASRGESRERVTYVTGLPDSDLAALYRRAWVCAAPSTYEGFGLPYLEAMSCGTAVVATPNPGSLEVLGEDYGGLVDDAAFGTTLVDLLTHESKRHALETAGIRRAMQFSADRMVDRYEAFLNELRGSDARSVVSA